MTSGQRVAPAEPPAALQALPTWLINQVAVRATRLVQEATRLPGARTDFAVLSTLHEFGEASQAELGRRLGYDRSDVAALVDRLERTGLLVRRADARDRRRKLVGLTDAGERALDRLAEDVQGAQAALLEPLGTEEQAALISYLQRLVRHHTNRAPRPRTDSDGPR